MQTCVSCILEVLELLIDTPEVFSAIEPTLIPLVPLTLQPCLACRAGV